MELATLNLLDEAVILQSGCYENGRPALLIVCEDGEPFATLSVNLPDPLEEGEVFVKTWSENAILREPILAIGVLEDTGKRVATGFVEAEVWRFAEVWSTL